MNLHEFQDEVKVVRRSRPKDWSKQLNVDASNARGILRYRLAKNQVEKVRGHVHRMMVARQDVGADDYL